MLMVTVAKDIIYSSAVRSQVCDRYTEIQWLAGQLLVKGKLLVTDNNRWTTEKKFLLSTIVFTPEVK